MSLIIEKSNSLKNKLNDLFQKLKMIIIDWAKSPKRIQKFQLLLKKEMLNNWQN